MSTEISQTEMQREKRIIIKEEKNIQKLGDSYNRCSICIMGIPEESEGNIWSNNGWEFSKINDRLQTTDPGN